jgi:hypothetical protein
MRRALFLIPPLVGWSALAVATKGGPAIWPWAFFVLVIAAPAALAVHRVFGPGPGSLAAGIAGLLLAAQTVLPPPQLRQEPALLARPFENERQLARHSLRLPAEDLEAIWRRTPEPRAYLYVALRLEPDRADSGLVIRVGESAPANLDGAARLSPLREAAASVETAWYRIALDRALVGGRSPLSVVVAPRGGPWPATAGVSLLGGFSFRPTDPPAPSAFFDGAAWSIEASALFPGYSGHAPVRYYVELRLVDPETGHLLAIYY